MKVFWLQQVSKASFALLSEIAIKKPNQTKPNHFQSLLLSLYKSET